MQTDSASIRSECILSVNGLYEYRFVLIPVISWFAAQLIKVVLFFIKYRKIDFARFVGSGGMPSSHSALVVSLTTVIGKNSGVNSAEFAICVVLSLIVMYDAAGIRQAAGKQAKVLNRLVHSHRDKLQIDADLKELLGHTPVEVFAGSALGIFIGLLL